MADTAVPRLAESATKYSRPSRTLSRRDEMGWGKVKVMVGCPKPMWLQGDSAM